MKRLISLLLILCLSLTLFAGCGAQEETPAQTTTTPPTTQEPEPTVSQAAIDALDGKKVMFIGNSYTYWGNCVINKQNSILSQAERSDDQGLFYQLCKANGISVSVTNWVYGAHNFTDIMSEKCLCEDAACEGQNHLNYLTDAYFDYVAIQCFYETEYAGDLISHLTPAMELFQEANPDVKFLLMVPHMGYERNFKWIPELEGLIEGDFLICNWGKMLYDIVEKTVTVPNAQQPYSRPTFVISKDEKDGHHQNMLAGYLTALMAYCAITGESAVGQPYDFCDDPTIHPNFDLEAYQEKYYIYEPYTNFVEVFRSEPDMLGLQELADQYLAKYNGTN